MTAVTDLDTPAVTVDLGIMEDNIRCVVSNMVDELYGVRGAAVEVVWPVAARGRVR
jgi:D-serine deaminase-like pyridoxal phosphate-dependent protein